MITRIKPEVEKFETPHGRGVYLQNVVNWTEFRGSPFTRPHQDEVVQVHPGVYRFTHYSAEKAFNPDAEGVVTFAHVERVGEVGQRGK